VSRGLHLGLLLAFFVAGSAAAQEDATPDAPVDGPASDGDSPAGSEESPPAAAEADELDDELDPGWVPGPGEETAETRQGADFTGMGFLFPVRLHLTQGGHLDGKVAGLDPESGEFMFVLPLSRFRIDSTLVRALTPLAKLPEPGSDRASRLPPPLVAATTTYKMKPTWRSGLGFALNLLAPGTGSFIQKEDKELGFLFLGLDIFFVSAGLLATLAPSRLTDRQRAFFGVVFFAFDGLTRGIGAGQAFAAGRERTLVEVRPEPGSGPGLHD